MKSIRARRHHSVSSSTVWTVALASLAGCGGVVGNDGKESTDRAGSADVGRRAEALRQATPIYLDRSFSPEERAADLVSRMTLAEKAAQLDSSSAPAIPRLGVAQYGWWNEALHGVAREQVRTGGNPLILTNLTSYPSPLSLGSTWDPDLQYREAVLISDEVRDVFRDNKFDLNIYSPTVNLARDPRWGRSDETFSEDPYLTAAMASQFVNGMQGNDPHGRPLVSGKGYLKTSTTIKHYAANNSEYNRLDGSSDMDDRTLREYYTRQFRDIIQAAHPSSIMSAYNRVNGTPASANVYLLDTLGRETFGFHGFYTSDCDAIYIMQAQQAWPPPGYTRPLNEVERHAFALTSGVDLNCNMGYHDAYHYGTQLPLAIAQQIATATGVINENDVDVAAVRLFATRIRLGEFDDDALVPWVTEARARLPRGSWVSSDTNGAATMTTERLELARQAADEAVVLLKNQATVRKDGTTGKLLPLEVPRSGSYRVAVIGYYAGNYYYTADEGDQAANPNLRTYLGGYSSDHYPAGIAKEVNGYQGIRAAVQALNRDAVVDYLAGFTSTRAPRTDGQYSAAVVEVDPAAVKVAGNYDAVIVYVGDDKSNAAEGGDRPSLSLPGAQESLIQQVAAQNPNTIVYVESIGQVDVGGFESNVAALLWSSYNGQRKGEGLADVLLGRKNPSGRIPFTWYKDPSQIPPMGDYGIRPSKTSYGRTYQYFTGDVRYPFGYGLSYTETRLSRMHLDQRHVDANGKLHVSALVTNTGRVAGAEVVQLYVSTPLAPASLQRPIKRLQGFQKVNLKPHETRLVEFTVDVPALAFYDEVAGHKVVDPGLYGIELGKSATDIEERSFVRVAGALRPAVSVATAKPVVAGDDAQGIAQRVNFPKRAVIDPRLTVALADDTIYGYITQGAGSPLPTGLTARYESNRPEIVSVDGSGVIRTGERSGTATVTAVVSYGGSTTTTKFVVNVPEAAAGE